MSPFPRNAGLCGREPWLQACKDGSDGRGAIPIASQLLVKPSQASQGLNFGIQPRPICSTFWALTTSARMWLGGHIAFMTFHDTIVGLISAVVTRVAVIACCCGHSWCSSHCAVHDYCQDNKRIRALTFPPLLVQPIGGKDLNPHQRCDCARPTRT